MSTNTSDINYTPICKKCLLEKLAESQGDLVQAIKNQISLIPDADRTPDDEYRRRLLACTECDFLADAMCRKCGCYVELRAAYQNRSCPGEHPRW